MIDHILADWPLWGLSTSASAANQVRSLPGGLTNHCFLLTLNGADYVLRVEGRNSAALDINRNAEFAIHQMAADLQLTPPVLFRSAEKHYWIRPYIHGRTLRSQDLTPPVLKQMLQQLHALHQLTLPADIQHAVPRLSITDKASYYWNMLAAQGISHQILNMRARLQQAMSVMPDERLCLCHMDPLPANWIEQDGTLTLLDWEYAALGHPLWDIAALLQAANVNAQEQQHLLQEVIAGKKNKGWDQSWQQANRQMQYLTALWYGAQGMWSARELQASLSALLNDAPAAYS